MCSLLVSLCESWLHALFAVDNKCCRTPTCKDEAAAGYWSAESNGQGICVSNDKEMLQANNSAASVPIPTVPESQGCEIGQELHLTGRTTHTLWNIG